MMMGADSEISESSLNPDTIPFTSVWTKPQERSEKEKKSEITPRGEQKSQLLFSMYGVIYLQIHVARFGVGGR